MRRPNRTKDIITKFGSRHWPVCIAGWTRPRAHGSRQPKDVQLGRAKVPWLCAWQAMTTLVHENLSVSVIVPARNEEASLAACLESLVGQAGVAFEVMVVDDGSTDQTRQIALACSGVEVLDAGPLPQGWTGKNHAMWQGARRAKGKWLLFTDADTVHRPGSLAAAIREADERGALLLSYSPQQEVRGFWEKAVMPVIFAELARAYSFREVNNPASRVAAANGQYLLIRRAIYEELNGHAAVRRDLLEDVSLARQVKSSGHRIFFRYGGDRVRTRMYRNFRQLREGWTKNLALLFPAARALAVRRLLEFVALAASAGWLCGAWLSTGSGSFHRFGTPAVLVLLFSVLARHVLRTRKAHFPGASLALSLLGLPMFAYLLLRSQHLYEKGQLAWKQRTYDYSRGETGTPTTRDVSRALGT